MKIRRDKIRINWMRVRLFFEKPFGIEFGTSRKSQAEVHSEIREVVMEKEYFVPVND
jgi:glucose-6-phosphate 1-dehydrogenase